MSLILAGLIAAGASGVLFAGRFLLRRGKADRSASKENPAEDSESNASKGNESGERKKDEKGGEKVGGAREPEPTEPAMEGFVCQLGDVIMRITEEAAWLAGGLVLSERRPVAALFVAPDKGHDTVIYVLPRPEDSLWWLAPIDAGIILVGGEPPPSTEQGGVRFERQRRLPLAPRRIGVGAPDVGDAVIVAEYYSAGSERLLVLKGTTAVYAYRGNELDASSYEVIASGSTSPSR